MVLLNLVWWETWTLELIWGGLTTTSSCCLEWLAKVDALTMTLTYAIFVVSPALFLSIYVYIVTSNYFWLILWYFSVLTGDAITGLRTFSICTPLQQQSVKSPALEAFEQEYSRQLASVLRIEKISVEYENLAGETSQLQMNKDLSTPYSCAKRKLWYIWWVAYVFYTYRVDTLL